MLTALIIDLVIVLIIALSIFLSARHGFMRTLIEVAGFIAAFLLASAFSSPLAEMTYDNMIAPSIVSNVQAASGGDSVDISDEIWDALPEIITSNSDKLGFDKSVIDEAVKSCSESGNSDNAEVVIKDVVKPVIVKLVSIIYSIVIVVVVTLLSRLLARIINNMFSFSLIGKINSALGGVVGAAKGMATVYLLCMIIYLLISVTKLDFGVFTPEIISKTYLFKIFYGFLPFT